MAANGSVVRITTGALDWSAGVNSDVVPTIRGPGNPNGLPQNSLAWGNNITVKGGTIAPRFGWDRLIAFAQGIGLFQEATLYVPRSDAFPYIIAQIAGRTFKVTVDTVPSVITEITIPGDPNPPDRPQAWMAQGEEFLIIQDGISLPLIWDGAVLRRSTGGSQVLGVIAIASAAPAVGAPVLLTLTGPFAGAVGDTVILNGKTYIVTDGTNFIDLFRNGFGTTYNTGDIVPAGTQVIAPGQPTMTTQAPFIVPLVGGTAQDVAVDAVPPGLAPAVLVDVNGDVNSWQIPATGLPPAGANQVYLVNLTDTPGTVIAVSANITSIGELPTAEPMVYYQGRFWLALGREYIAGDIVGGPSGTAAYNYRDSILRMTENTYTALGGTFSVPTSAGNIRALNYPANINNFLGQGPLLIFTRQQVYAADIPISRADWVATTGATGIVVKIMQINFGTTSDRSVVHVNGDVFYQSVDGVRSLFTAVRNFGEWGDLPISVEEARAIDQNDRGLLRFGSGVNWKNHLLETCLPVQTDVGVVHKGILPLSFDLLSTLQAKLPPAWLGIWEGVDVLRLLRGDFGGRERCFALIRSSITGGIEVWELTDYLLEDNNSFGDSRINWRWETPSFTFGTPFELKELDTVEYWVDRVSGDVEIQWEFKTDAHPCWELYWKHKICSPRNSCEDCGVLLPCEYPSELYPRGYRATIVLPKPPSRCEYSQSRPINIGYSFQFRVTIKGSMRIRGLMVHAFPRDKQPYLSVTDPCSSAACGT